MSPLSLLPDADLVRSYLRDIGRVPLLSHQQEITPVSYTHLTLPTR